MPWFVIPFVVVAVLLWGSAMVHWLLSLRHLSGQVSLAAMLFRGIEAFRPENFTPAGQALQKRFLYSFLGFIGTVLLGAIVGAVAAGR